METRTVFKYLDYQGGFPTREHFTRNLKIFSETLELERYLENLEIK